MKQPHLWVCSELQTENSQLCTSVRAFGPDVPALLTFMLAVCVLE